MQWVGLFLFFLSGCANLGSLQTAKTLPPKEGRAFAGGGYTESPAIDANVSAAGSAKPLTKVGYGQVGARLGISEHFDVGARATLLGTVQGDVKYQFLDAGPLAMAVGFGLGLLRINSSDNDRGIYVTDVFVPFYASLEPIPYFTLYGVAKYFFRWITGPSSSTSHLGAATVGVKLGSDYGIMAEATYAYDLKFTYYRPIQFDAAVFWKYGGGSGR